MHALPRAAAHRSIHKHMHACFASCCGAPLHTQTHACMLCLVLRRTAPYSDSRWFACCSMANTSYLCVCMWKVGGQETRRGGKSEHQDDEAKSGLMEKSTEWLCDKAPHVSPCLHLCSALPCANHTHTTHTGPPRFLSSPVVVQAKQRANANVVNATPECAVLRQEPMTIIAFRATYVHFGKRWAVISLLEQCEGPHLMHMHVHGAGGAGGVCVEGMG
jgi:hypothetical protein